MTREQQRKQLLRCEIMAINLRLEAELCLRKAALLYKAADILDGGARGWAGAVVAELSQKRPDLFCVRQEK